MLGVFSTGEAQAWGERDFPYYLVPEPAYVYDHSAGPRWTSNGWSYPPVGAFYAPAPPPFYAPQVYPGPFFGGTRDYPVPVPHRTVPHW
jgi:hypothetical protein